jgi:uncharacterized lipoprotein YmbA
MIDDPRRRRRPIARRPGVLLAAIGLMAAGCSTTPTTRFHTLLPAPVAAVSRATPTTPVQAWELGSVTVPLQVDQPQFVVRMPDDTLAVLEYERWIAPLGDEIRAALIQRIGSAFAANSSSAAAPAAQGKTWRVAIDVQRFDSAVGRYARAAELFAAVVTDAPDCDYCHYALARCLKALGRGEEARGHLRLARALHPACETYRTPLDGVD